ncbi:MAG: hypothetical protein HY927_04160 [Elusimicrobia bacterium]|nr:hypothetical protein [Elusimicrobiota bacterium]
MSRILAAVLSLVLAGEPVLMAAQPSGPAVERGASAGADEREAMLRELVELLGSLSDEDYTAAIMQVPKGMRGAQPASRRAAIKSAYRTLAGLEYEKASGEASGDAAARYAQDLERVTAAREGGPAAGAAGPQEAGQALSVLKWLANAVLNYWVKGGQTYVGRRIKTGPEAASERSLAGLDMELSSAELDAGRKAELHYRKGSLYEKLAEDPGETEQARMARKAERIGKLAELVASVSDEDYREALKSLPGERRSKLESRAKVLHSAYTTMAALEYRQASQAGTDDRYAQAYERVSREGAEALAIDPVTLQETGWAADLFKFVGNAVLNYWLHGGEDYMSRGWKGRGGSAGPEAGPAAEEAGAKLGPGGEPQRHFELGAEYEKLAAAALKGESEDEIAARQAGRLKMLAELLESVSDEEYAEVVKSLPSGSPARSQKASRSKILQQAYTTLAGLEYRAAVKASPGEGEIAEFKRINREGASNLVVDPATLQETGWGTKLLGLLALGGMGFGIYEYQRRHPGRSKPSTPAPPTPVSPTPKPDDPVCPEGTVWKNGKCLKNAHEGGGRVCVECPDLPCGCDCLGMPQVCPRDRGHCQAGSTCARHADLYKSADGVERELASAALGPATAGLHRQLGGLYERLAGAQVTAEEAAPPAGKAAEKVASAPARPEAPKTPPVLEPPVGKPEAPLALLPSGPAGRDIMLLWDGSRLEGEVTAASLEKIVMKTDDGITGVKQERIRALILRGAGLAAETGEVQMLASKESLPLIVKADGTSARGRMASASPRQIVFRLADGILTYARGDVRAVVFPVAGKKPK